MNNYFYKISQFDFDYIQLYKEWYIVASKHNLFERTKEANSRYASPFYTMLRINYPTNEPNIDPVVLPKGPLYETNYTFVANNIHKDFIGTKTEQVAKQVANFIENKFTQYNISQIKYHSLAPRSNISLHKDMTDVPRFFLFVHVNPLCVMDIGGSKVIMSEVGALYKFNARALHSPVNNSDEYRVCMVFDCYKKSN